MGFLRDLKLPDDRRSPPNPIIGSHPRILKLFSAVFRRSAAMNLRGGRLEGTPATSCPAEWLPREGRPRSRVEKVDFSHSIH